MKLIYCQKCCDVISLRKEKRSCYCGTISGYYQQDGITAVISSDAIPVGFVNSEFLRTVYSRPTEGLGKEFTAFVIPEHCSTIIIGE